MFSSIALRLASVPKSAALARSFSLSATARAHPVFVGNLDHYITDDAFRSHFAQAGEIESIKVVRDFATGQAKGYGFVEYADASGQENAIKLDASELDGRALRVNISTPRPDGFSSRAQGGNSFDSPRSNSFTRPELVPNPSAVFLTSVPANITLEQICKTFGKFGVLKSVALYFDEELQSRGNSTVQFLEESAAASALAAAEAVEGSESIMTLETGDEVHIKQAVSRPRPMGGRGNSGPRRY